MRFLYGLGLLALFFSVVLWPTVSQATHVRAGEITTKRISSSSLTYEITFIAYFDYTPGGGRNAADRGNTYTICFGDGTSQPVTRLPPTYINNRTSSINVYRVIHTYPAPNPYTISVTVSNRNADTKNLQQPSEGIRFFRFNDDFNRDQPGPELHTRPA